MASDPPNTGAAFTYSLELDVIKIEDLYTGTKRVADDIQRVLRKIESWHQGPIIWLPHHVPRIEWALEVNWSAIGRRITSSTTAEAAKQEISRFSCKERTYMPGSKTTQGRTGTRFIAPVRCCLPLR